MELGRFTQVSETEWRVEPFGAMHVPAVLFATAALVRDMDDKVFEQMTNVAMLPGIVDASYAMPDAHWGYGFPIGGVAAFDPERGGVISAGGVGFDISCGVRTLTTGLHAADVEGVKTALADSLARNIPAGVGSTGAIRLDEARMNAMLEGGAEWAVGSGWGVAADLERIEEHGKMAGAEPSRVSAHARKRQQDEIGTLGSGNHYLEVQRVAAIYDEAAARVFGLAEDDAVISIHCGSRGLGHQIGTEFLAEMVESAAAHHITLPDRELACAPINSGIGQAYLGAMRAAVNCAFANRQILTHLTRRIVGHHLPAAELMLLYDVSHNTCKEEIHEIDGRKRRLFVHRKGATRAFGPGHPDLPEALRGVGQPVLIGGSMGTHSYVLAGSRSADTAERGAAEAERAFSSACHGAGRAMSRHQALKQWRGRAVVDELAQRGILIRSRSLRGVAEEAPGAYKDVGAVVEAAEKAGLARRVARLDPIICVKG